jgi:hypothetical protein
MRAPRGFAGRLHGGEQQGNQQANDCDDDEQLDERKTARVQAKAGHATGPHGQQRQDEGGDPGYLAANRGCCLPDSAAERAKTWPARRRERQS